MTLELSWCKAKELSIHTHKKLVTGVLGEEAA